jgi:hypothetical protein
MIQFLRKHQKGFMIIIAAMMILSFSVFGTYSAVAGSNTVEDKVIGKTVTGREITQQQVASVIRFLMGSPAQGGGRINLLDDGFLVRDFLETGLANHLVEANFDKVKEDLQTRIERLRSFRPYAHPAAPYLNATGIWQQFAPMISAGLKNAKLQMTIQPGTFELLAQLYLAQASFSSETLRRILSYQQTQFQLQADPALQRDNLSVGGFSGPEDWFGANFLDIAARFLIDSAALAEKNGHSVSEAQARKALLANVARAVEQDGGQQDVRHLFNQQLLALGISEQGAVSVWKQVLLMRKACEEKTVVTAPAKMLETVATIEQYELPELFRLRTFQDLLKVQIYLDGVAPASSKSRGFCYRLPSQLLPIQEIEKQAPEFICKRFELEFASVERDELSQRIGLKETWEWELEESHWRELKGKFPALAPLPATTREERFAALESIDSQVRFTIDTYARDKIAESHPEWLDEMLAGKERKKVSVAIPHRGAVPHFDGVTNPAQFIFALETQHQVRYSDNGKTVYQIGVLSAKPEKELLTFEEANRSKILGALLDKKLEAAHLDARKKDPKSFQRADGNFKPFNEVKNQIGAYLYAPLLKLLDEQAGWKAGEARSLESYAPIRFHAYMKEMRAALEADPSQIGSGVEQWRLVRTNKEIRQATFTMGEGEWSEVKVGEPTFFRLITKVGVEVPAPQNTKEARRTAMATLFKEIAKHE